MDELSDGNFNSEILQEIDHRVEEYITAKEQREMEKMLPDYLSSDNSLHEEDLVPVEEDLDRVNFLRRMNVSNFFGDY